jgi:hypothetical protein
MKKFESLGRMLSKAEQKKIMGGLCGEDCGSNPTCRHHCNQGGIIFISDCEHKADAVQGATDCDTVWGTGHGGWCCDYCESAGWGGCSA